MQGRKTESEDGVGGPSTCYGHSRHDHVFSSYSFKKDPIETGITLSCYWIMLHASLLGNIFTGNSEASASELIIKIWAISLTEETLIVYKDTCLPTRRSML